MALFGAPIALEDHAVRACYAGLAIQRSLEALSDEARANFGVELLGRVGLNSGDVVVRAIGNDLSMDYDAIGATVHLASRMEQLAPPGSIRMAQQTAHLAEGFVELRALGNVPVKGMAEPVAAFDLVGASTARTRLQAAAARGLTPFVGREAEIEVIEAAWRLASEGEGQVVALVGEPGVGKSRLCHEFVSSYRLRDWRVLVAGSVSSGQAGAWEPVVDLLRQYFEIDEGDDDRRIGEKILGRLLRLDEAFRSALPAFLNLFGLPSEDEAWVRLGVPRQRRRMLDSVKSLLARECDEHPLAIVLEDMHWVDSETQSLVDELVDSLPGHRMLLLANFRPEYRHNWSSRAFYQQLRLDPLGEDGARVLLDSLLGTGSKLADLKKQLLERADGSPLFLEESVRDLVETGVLEGTKGAYTQVRPSSEVETPDAVVAIIAARIDRLPAGQKALVQLLSVVGEEVPLLLLAEASELDEESLRAGLSALCGRELIYEMKLFPEIEYAFAHGVTRGVAYGGLLSDSRRQLHKAVGQALKAQYDQNTDELAYLLAHHFQEARDWPQATTYLLHAAQRARRQFTYPRAADFARRAVEIAEREKLPVATRIETRELLGDLESLLGALEPANSAYEAALDLAEEAAGRERIESKRHIPGTAIRDGARIAYYHHGRGDTTLLFVNPIVYGLATFQPLLEQLCQEFQVITLDPRGTGASDPLVRPYRLRQHAEDVAAVIEAADCAPITGVGISRGGNLLVNLAEMHPHLVERLVLIGTPPDYMGSDSPVPRVGYIERTLELSAEGDVETLADILTTRVFSEPSADDIAKGAASNLLAMPRESFLSFFDVDHDLDIQAYLPNLNIPILLTHGTEDRQVDFAAAPYLLERLPNATLYPFEGYGHLPHVTALHEFCHVLRQFIRHGRVTEPYHPSLDAA